ncbi:MAG: nucleoside kinase [Anaerovoracaceae bacterium]
MEIRLRKEIGRPFESISVSEGLTMEELAMSYKGELKYEVLAGKVNNEIVELTTPLTDGATVEFMDMRYQAANLIYQNSLSFLFIKAATDVIDGAFVEIQNSINKGLYIEVKGKETINEAKIKEVGLRMRQLIKMDLPFIKTKVPRKEAAALMKEGMFFEKLKLINQRINLRELKFYEVEGYKNFFYSVMVPSTRYCDIFEVRKYRRGVLLRFPHPSNPNVIPEYEDERNLYSAFSEATKWKRVLNINYVSDLNEQILRGEDRELMQLSEALHDKKIVEIAGEITEKGKRIILIAGPSSSGKTTFARRLCIQLKVNGLKPIYLGTDDYFINRDDMEVDENGEKNYEDLEAVDVRLFNEHMNSLLEGAEVSLPVFDFIKGVKTFGAKKTKITPSQPIVIEGIHALNGKLTEGIADSEKYKIYISPLTQLNIDRHNRIPTTDARMLRRMVRDHNHRGHSAKDTIRDWPKVRAGEDKNIFPYSGEADVLFNSVHIYELSVLKKYAQPLLMNIEPDSEEYAEARRMLNFLKYFQVIENDEIVPNNSILREFIGGSVFG